MSNSLRFLLLILLVIWCMPSKAQVHNGSIKNFEYSETIEVPNTSQAVLFNSASMWLHDFFRNNPARIKIQDNGTGIIYGEADLVDKQADYAATFSISFKIYDGKYIYVFNQYYNNAGSFEKSKPDCCISDKKWAKIKVWAKTETTTMIKSLKDKLKTKSATDEFITFPLLDTAKNYSTHHAATEPIAVHGQPLTYFLQGGAAYSPIINNNSSASTGFHRHGGGNGTFTPTSAQPILNYHAELGIYLPNRLDNTRGFGIKAGYFAFPLILKGTTISYATGTAQNIDGTTTTNCSYIALTPNYTMLSRKKNKYQLSGSIGMDVLLTTTNNMKNMIGPNAQLGYGINGWYLSATLDYAVNNIYGSSTGGFRQGGGFSLQPLFCGIGIAFYPQKNKWIKKIL